MRLTCPNCAARYELADGMLAAGGQHVQCSACHTRWFERPPGQPAAAVLEDEILARLEARGSRSPRPMAPRRTGPDFAWEGPDDAPAAPREGTGRPGPHLRLVAADADEAEPDSASGEVEPDSAAVEADEAAPAGAGPSWSEASGRAEPSRDEDRAAATAAGALTPTSGPAAEEMLQPAKRRLDLDAAGKEPRAEEPEAPSRRMSSGLIVGLVVVAVLAGTYLAAEDLAEAVPALEPPLRAFLGAVDEARLSLGGGSGEVGGEAPGN